MKKGITFEYVIKFLENLECRLLNTKDEFEVIMNNDSKYKRINIVSRCGHESNDVALSRILKNRKYIYCNDCSEIGAIRKCLKCNKEFLIEKNNDNYCSIQCRNSREITNETKKKISDGVIRRNEQDGKQKKVKEPKIRWLK
jgi:hypothetical protein